MADAGMSLGLLAALLSVAELLSFSKEKNPPIWLLGGSSGLLLHNVPLSSPPRDIDLYADLAAAERLHGALSAYAVGEPAADWSKGCYSLRSHYRVQGVAVELVCGFQISSGLSKYIVEVERLMQHAPLQDYFGCEPVRLMPLAHELVFNMLRGRSDRYDQLADVMSRELPLHLPLLCELIHYNTWDATHIQRLEDLLYLSPPGVWHRRKEVDHETAARIDSSI
ncbi:hypothetical protein [Paenibacillus albidus]|uniref:hypothetical protein n=1 Tax=Paenibacillus albidus TaxID=2041023 RepID=UPI001BEA7D13|nr:hypothetical protein [Paenibacillus albidus]